jgi:hypothetical protein
MQRIITNEQMTAHYKNDAKWQRIIKNDAKWQRISIKYEKCYIIRNDLKWQRLLKTMQTEALLKTMQITGIIKNDAKW